MKTRNVISTLGFGLLLIGIFAMVIPVRATTVTVASVVADKDALVWDLSPNGNFGTDQTVQFGNVSNNIEEAYIGFTFTKPTSTWTNAKIELTVPWVLAAITMNVSRVSGAWNETGMQGNITWNNRPARDPSFTSQGLSVSTTKITIDVTSLMPSVTNDLSICLFTPVFVPDGYAVVYSREWTSTSERPVLVFTNEVVDTTPAGIAGYDVGFIALTALGSILLLGKKIRRNS